MSGLTKFMGTLATGDTSFRETAMNIKIRNLVIDTVESPDCGWETGIKKNGEWIIVEEYPNKKEAKKGHKEWIKSIKENPTQKLKQCRSVEDWAFGY